MTSASLYNYVLERFHNTDPIIRKKNKNKKTVLFADIITHINQLVDVESGNPASARINQRNFRRLIGMLTDNQRKLLIIKLLAHIYIAPFLRYSVVVFLVLFRLYHAHHSDFITNRLNNSTIIAGFWSNYRLSIPTNGIYNRGIYNNNIKQIYPLTGQSFLKSSLSAYTDSDENLKVTYITSQNDRCYNTYNRLMNNYDYSSIKLKPLPITALKRNRNISNCIVSIRNELNQVQRELYNWTHTKYIDNRNIRNILSISNKRKSYNSSKISKIVPVKSSLYDQIRVSHPMAAVPTIKNILTQKKNLGNARVYSNKKQIRNKKIKKNGKDYITGYILPERGVAVIIEDGKTYIYKLPKYMLDKYLANYVSV